jgi:glycosidase
MKPIAKKVPAWFEKTVLYQINLRSFTRDGTLRSATKMLPHVRSLGVDMVYLCPFVMSDDDMDQNGWSNRQKKSGANNPKNSYRISDYFTVDPEYGNDEDVECFVKTAHSLGLRVMFDLVYMHCGPNAVFIKEHPDFVQHKEDGTLDLTIYNFPKINFESAGLREYLYENMLYFVRRFDIDGYRCDVGDACPMDFWIEGSRRVRELKPDFIMLNEGRSAYGLETCFDVNYGFNWGRPLVKILRGKMKAHELRDNWVIDTDKNPKGARMIRWYENHDESNDAYDDRIDKKMDGAAGELALVLSFMIDGVPMIFNGNEICDSGWISFFHNRFSVGNQSIDWSDALTEKGQRRLSLTKKLCQMRQKKRILTAGQTIWSDNDHMEEVVSFDRVYGKKSISVIANMTEKPITCTYKTDANTEWLSRGTEFVSEENGVKVTLDPFGYLVLKN